MAIISAEITLYEDTKTNLDATDPTLESGRPVIEDDVSGGVRRLKIHDGVNPHTDLPYMSCERKRSLAVFASGRPADSERIWRDKVSASTAFTIPAGGADCNASAGVAATGTTTITLKKNGVSVGTFVWSAAGTEAVVTVSSEVVFAAGDIRELTAQATSDATLADISITLGGKI